MSCELIWKTGREILHMQHIIYLRLAPRRRAIDSSLVATVEMLVNINRNPG